MVIPPFIFNVPRYPAYVLHPVAVFPLCMMDVWPVMSTKEVVLLAMYINEASDELVTVTSPPIVTSPAFPR